MSYLIFIPYRELIHKLMREAWNDSKQQVDRNLAHLRSEMLKSIFDVDKMLYFVAPEWWQPRLNRSQLDVGVDRSESSFGKVSEQTKIKAAEYVLGQHNRIQAAINGQAAKTKLGTLGTENLVGWGGEGRPDNYLITEDSAPAKLGSSLGWLLQLDGDNLRNAFLNAPWVKAVIPVRPGREEDALEWLKQSQVEGTEGLNEIYAGDDNNTFKAKYAQRHEVAKEELTIEEVLNLVVEDINTKHVSSTEVIKEQVELEPGQIKDIFYLTPDKVFEKGFDPLKDGFRATPGNANFEVFDQWIEVAPTDQIVAVEVNYDPKSGMQIDV